jgi:MOSC domain-containing protein YiiM
MNGEVVAIWIKRAKRGVMDPVAEARAVPARGLAGNANQGGRRQVTIIDEDAWHAATAEVGANVDPSKRRANVMLRGVPLARTRGMLLRLGDVVIRILGETRPCEQMEDANPGLRHALDPDWRAGVFGEIVEGGTLRVGDAASLE